MISSAGGSADASFDAERVVVEFLNDIARTSLALPPQLTADQRRHVRRLAELQPGVRSESYGFGAERQVYLFKGCNNPTANTTSSPAADNAKVSSAKLVLGASAFAGGKAQSPQASDESSGERSPASVVLGATSNQWRRRKFASGGRAPPEGWELVKLPEGHGLQVRNTFIHVDEDGEDAPEDGRLWQSMPDGRFAENLRTEPLAQARSETTDRLAEVNAPTVCFHPGPDVGSTSSTGYVFSPGTIVVIEGLEKSPAFNGVSAVVESVDSETGRYNVLLAVGESAGDADSPPRRAKVKAVNLRVALPPPLSVLARAEGALRVSSLV